MIHYSNLWYMKMRNIKEEKVKDTLPKRVEDTLENEGYAIQCLMRFFFYRFTFQ